MAPLKCFVLFVSWLLACCNGISNPSEQLGPVYNAISSLPLFPQHGRPFNSYSVKPFFQLPNHYSPNSIEHEPTIILHDSPPVYKPEPTPVYRPNPLTPKYTPNPPPQLFRDPSPSYKPSIHSDIHNDITHEPQITYASEESYKPEPVYEERTKPYSFDYGVQDQYSGANFGHSESSDGKAVKGSYTVALPDGRIQRVTYTADEHSGFQAQVTYEGEAQFPKYVPKAKPSFHPHSGEYQPKAERLHLPEHLQLPEYKPEPEYTPPHLLPNRYTSPQHGPDAIHNPIPKPLQHDIPPYNPLPTSGAYSPSPLSIFH